jgi:predicted AlkP superfamily pyrophosphatase or phosphodiesterase
MINDRSIQKVSESTFGPFRKPLATSYSFSKIPATIERLFGKTDVDALPEDVYGEGAYDYVIFFLLDGFGYKMFQKCAKSLPFLQRICDFGRVSMLTSQFPSTTTGHITTLHTGLSVEQTGLYEWYYYEPLADAPIIAMRFSYAIDKKINSLYQANITPDDLFCFPTIYQSLERFGVTPYIFQTKDIVKTPYSKRLQIGAQTIGYKSFREGLNKLKRTYAESSAEKAYFFFYYPEIDTYGHHNGPNSQVLEKEITHCFNELEYFWQTFGRKEGKKTACVIAADHGMAQVDPKKTIFLNLELPKLVEYLQKNKKGEPIVPCGSSRDFFLHVEPKYVRKVVEDLQQVLRKNAEVFTTQALIDAGVFHNVTTRFLERVGNVVILPHAPYTVWWHDDRLPTHTCLGHHGGLSSDEMEIPFLIIEM